MNSFLRVAFLGAGLVLDGQATATTDCSTCTSEEGGSNPIIINNVMNYGYSALIGSATLNAGSTIDDIYNPTNQSGYTTPTYSFGEGEVNWTYYNNCPSIYYDAGSASCKCNGAENITVGSTGLLYFGSQNYSGTDPVDGGSWNPSGQMSILSTSSNEGSAYSITYQQALTPTVQNYQSASGISEYPGDVLFTLFGNPLGTAGVNPTSVWAKDQVLFNFWNSTGSKSYSGGTGDCTSADKGYGDHTFDIISNEYSQYVDQFNLTNSPQYGVTFNTSASDNPPYTVSSDNISVVNCSSSSCPQTLYSDNGGSSPNYNQAFVPDLNSGVEAESAPGGEASVNINTNIWNGSLTETYSVSANMTEGNTQTTQQGVTNTNSETQTANISVTLGDTENLTVTDGVTTGEDSLSASFNAGYQQSLSNTQEVDYSTTSQTNSSTSTTVGMSATLSLASSSDSTGTYSIPGSSDALVSSENNSTTTGTFDNGACYLLALTQNEGYAYLDSNYTIEMESNSYGVLPVIINSTELNITNTPINILTNAANTFQWWNTEKYQALLGDGDPSSLQVNSSGNLTVLGAAQLQSGVTSDLTVNMLEQSCSSISATQVELQKISGSAKASRANDVARMQPPFPWVPSSELVNSRFNGYPNGIGYTPRHGHGFAIDQRNSEQGVFYVGSQTRDIVKLGGGNDTVVVGDGADLVYSGGGRDRVSGGKGSNSLFGQDGDDLLIAGVDNDSMIGGPGADQLVGGGGVDKYSPGSGDDSLFLDFEATSQIVGLSIKDKVYVGKFSVGKSGFKVNRLKDMSKNYILTPSYSIGFARLTDKKSGKVVGMVKSWGNLYSARPAVWTDIALINVSTLPSALFKGVNVTSKGLEVLASSEKQWHFEEGFKRGASVYKYSDWNDLRARPNELARWIKRISLKLTGKQVKQKDMPRLVAGAQNQASAAGFVISYF